MSAPTWQGWAEVITAQNADVESHSACLYLGIWNQDHRDWIPEVYDTGLPWNFCNPIVHDSVDMLLRQFISSEEASLWNQVRPTVTTTWFPVQYPN